MKGDMNKKVRFGFILILALLLTSCYYENSSRSRIEASGPVRTETLEIDDFEGLNLANSADVFLRPGTKQEVVVRGQENIINNLSTEVSSGILKIRNRRPVWRRYDLEIEITVPTLRLIKLSGSGDIVTEQAFEDLDDLEVIISGSGSITANCEAENLESVISGSGRIDLDGKARQLDCRVTGSGSIHAYDLETKYATVVVSGSGSAKINTTKELDVRISGSGSVAYKGNPRVDKKISGSGGVYNR